MSKRKNQYSYKLTPAAKKMAHEQGESSSSSSEEKMFHYHQDRIDLSSLYLATKFADVHFVFNSDDGTKTRIPAHKMLLAVTSDVFEKMFCGELAENGDIRIVDASEAAFKEFLQFFYLNDVKLSAKHVGSVLYLGNKYNVENCVDACVECLASDSSNENICAALSLAILHEQKELAKACKKHIMLNAADILKSDGFLECSKEALAHILKMGLLSCSEVEVFEACMEWVRAKSKQPAVSKAMVDEHLGELYYQIRFASMTLKEFYALETRYKSILSGDFEAIIRIITQKDTDPDTHPERFNTSPRQVKWIEYGKDDAVIDCTRDYEDGNLKFPALDIEERTIFSISEPLVLGEFVCNMIHVGEHSESKREDVRSDLTVEVKITEARTLDNPNDVKDLCRTTAGVGIDFTYILLPHPILVRPGWFYTICMKGFPQGHYFGSSEQASSMTLESNIKIKFYNDKVVDGKIYGFIWRLIFNKVLNAND